MGQGIGIALSGTPRDAMRVMEKEAQYNAAVSTSKSKEKAAAAKAEEAAYQKIVANDFKIDPKLYHRKLLPIVQKEAADVLNKIANAHAKDPYNGLNSVNQLMLDYKSRLNEMQQQSKLFFDYEALDPTKNNIDPEMKKALNSNPGDLTDVKELVDKSRGLRGYDIGQDGYIYFNAPAKVDMNTYTQEFKKQKDAYSEKPNGAKASGIAGVMQLGTEFIPNQDLLTALKDQMNNDPLVQANLLFNTPLDQIPADVDINNKASLGAFTKSLVDKHVADNVKPYKTYTPHNIPTEGGAAKSKEGFINIGNELGYQKGNNLWVLQRQPETDNEYFLTVRTKNDKGEPTDQKVINWPVYNEKDGTYKQVPGTLAGFKIDSKTKSIRVLIAEPTKVQVAAGEGPVAVSSGVNNFNINSGDKGVYDTKPIETDIGWNPRLKATLMGEYKVRSTDIFNELYQKQFGGKPINIWNPKKPKEAASKGAQNVPQTTTTSSKDSTSKEPYKDKKGGMNTTTANPKPIHTM